MSEAPTQSFYDAFYSRGGWRYSLLREWWWHRRNLVKRLRLRRGMSMLEIASGLGFHTSLFNRMGLRCVGVDVCETAVRLARDRYPQCVFHQADARGPIPVAKNSFDAVVTRGCSLYHYDLLAPAPLEATGNLIDYLKPGGVFVLIILSDLSGRREPGKVWQNRMEDYEAHFSRFGRSYTVDWHKGMVICAFRQSAGTSGR